MKRAKITKIDDSTYCFAEAAFGTDVYMYLLIGKEKALLIDTGYGFTDVPGAICELTDLPLIVINTHGHMDHIHGNHLYTEVYLADEDEVIFARHTEYVYLMKLMKQIAHENHLPSFLLRIPFLNAKKIATAYPSIHKPLPPEMAFELGERKVRILKTPGHTIGSICLLDEKNQWLFSGDTTCHDGVLLHFPESTDVATFKDSIFKLKAMADDGRIIQLFPAHQVTPIGTEILVIFLEACEMLLSGQYDEKSKRRRRLNHKGLAIVFEENKIGGNIQ